MSQPPEVARCADPFASTFGKRRGHPATGQAPPQPPTPRDRARLLACWIEVEAGRTDRLGRVRDENRRAEELGVRLVHGRWTPLGTDADSIDSDAMLTLLYEADDTRDCMGVIEVSAGGSVILHLCDDSRNRRSLKP